MRQLNAAVAMSRQNASSSGASGISHQQSGMLRIHRNQLTGVFGVMPVLLQVGGQVQYGVPLDMARKMADEVIKEKQLRLESHLPDHRQVELQKEIDKVRQAALKVRLVRCECFSILGCMK
jgi:hypothetical protein